MDTTLHVHLLLNSDCGIVAFDKSPYAEMVEIDGHSIVETLQDSKGVTVEQRVHSIKNNRDPLIFQSEPMMLPKDGTYTYSRYLVPKFGHDYAQPMDLYSLEYYTKEMENGTTELFKKYPDGREEIVIDYTELIKERDKDSEIFWFQEKIFSLCKLNKCITSYIRKNIAENVKTGCDFSCKSNPLQAQIDFMLESSFALRFLVEQGKFSDAQRILDSLTVCSGICSEAINDNGTSDCGCGKTS